MDKNKFKKRYVLGTGHPFIEPARRITISMFNKNTEGCKEVELENPDELYQATPKYRLVLERVK